MAFNRFFESLGQDFRYGVRVLRLNPGFAATAILSLALGIAANTSIFTLTDQILLRLLPVQNPRELVAVPHGRRTGRFTERRRASHVLVSDVRRLSRSQHGLLGPDRSVTTERLSLLAGDRSEMVDVGLGGRQLLPRARSAARTSDALLDGRRRSSQATATSRGRAPVRLLADPVRRTRGRPGLDDPAERCAVHRRRRRRARIRRAPTPDSSHSCGRR